MVLDDATWQQGIESTDSHDYERSSASLSPRRVACFRVRAYKRRDAFLTRGWFMTFGTKLFTMMRGELVGTDAEGNRYYQDKRLIAGQRRKRWVLYKGEAEASRVPPDWHGWLHHTTNTMPMQGGEPRQAWQKDHVRNLSGTDLAYRPPGHTLSEGGEKPKAPYEAWRPGS